MNELWKDIKGYEGLYQVSNLGKVKSLPKLDSIGRPVKPRIMKLEEEKYGYLKVGLWKDAKCKKFMVHRLVAQSFIENPSDKPHINHKDGNKKNNEVTNLEWSTPLENTQHALKNGLKKNLNPNGKKVEITNCDNGISIAMESQYEASVFFGYGRGWLQSMIKLKGNPFYKNNYKIELLVE